MAWLGIEAHDAVADRFRRMVARRRLASTFLFVGPPGIGKRAFARRLAQVLLCADRPGGELKACGKCYSCLQMNAGTHPDYLTVSRPKDRASIPVAAFIGDAEHRMQSGLCHDIALKPMLGPRRVAVIDDADDLNEESANCLLKTLEEPPPGSLLILIGTSVARQLPTIRSRSQIVRFSPLSEELVQRLLVSTGVAADATTARTLASLCGGSLDRAKELADPELLKFRSSLLSHLAGADIDVQRLAEAVTATVEAAGTEVPARRERLRSIVSFALDFYRQLARSITGMNPVGDAPLISAVQSVTAHALIDAEGVANLSERCLDAIDQVGRNAHHVNLIYAWIDDLAEFGRAAGELSR